MGGKVGEGGSLFSFLAPLVSVTVKESSQFKEKNCCKGGTRNLYTSKNEKEKVSVRVQRIPIEPLKGREEVQETWPKWSIESKKKEGASRTRREGGAEEDKKNAQGIGVATLNAP